MRPSFIVAFDRYGISLWQGPRVSSALRLPWTDVHTIQPADVSSGTRRSVGLEIQLGNIAHATLAFVRDPQKPYGA